MKRVWILFFFLSANLAAHGQCAMCRSTLENNYSNGSPGLAAGINTGILYLLAMPYLAVIILAYLWYKSSRNARKELNDRIA